MNGEQATETEVVQEAKQLQKTAVAPQTVEELAALEGNRGVELIKRRLDILAAARLGSIARTFPRDWVLFKAESGIYGYLQDSGCERVKDIWGINIFNVSDFIHEDQEDGSRLYIITGDGTSNLTRSTVERVIGARDTDSMLMGRKDVSPAQLKLDTMKGARSNLDGGIVRHLAGLASVPIEELNRIFGRSESQDLTGFNLGKGFGSQAVRAGATPEKQESYGPAPKCPTCKATMKFFEGRSGREPFWGCPNYRECKQKPITAKKVVKAQDPAEPPHDEREPGEDDWGEEPPQTLPEGEKKPEQRIGEIKNRLTLMLKNIPNSKSLLGQIFAAKTTDELMDLELVAADAVKAAKKGGKL